MALSFQPYNITLPHYSSLFTYLPIREGSSATAWNSSYTDISVNQAAQDALSGKQDGWHGVGVPFRTTQLNGATVSLNFTGTAIYMCFATTKPWQLFVDGERLQTAAPLPDPACSIYGSQAGILAVAANLTLGAHNATLEIGTVDDLDPSSFYGATVTISAGQPGPKRTEVIGSSDSSWQWSGLWTTPTDQYMWDGQYQTSANYGPNNSVSYTFQGASALILRGLSTCVTGPYTVTLDNDVFRGNATDYWWRFSGNILYIAGGLDPTQSHTITLMNYDPRYTEDLTLIMDDTSTRDAMLATLNTTGGNSNGSSPALPIVAGVLGGLLFIMLILVAWLSILWMRSNKELRSTRYIGALKDEGVDETLSRLTPWVPNEPASVASNSTPALGRLTSSDLASVSASAVAGNEQHSRKRAGRMTSANNSEADPLPQQDSDGNADPAGQQAAPRTETRAPVRRGTTRQNLGDLVSSLSALLNGHLHQEYLEQEATLERPPEYPEDEAARTHEQEQARRSV
ncbi:hypothetical protein DACRYDRAFT_104701 [Dacryopinax primogenitus]|uniref:Transmembrane protein n=1 Tax=Dacryopinax primogenitus (strain DJM 731) TaxID=1858805 RepID=M5G9C9_DACPD|nr:uncharacterized protein DACRYDRAFT_104701 [Dacryopinax primogenitus]EJU04830.1 hypothetical protein DACRYDRAFT_104701 [Dacryopinax primogenitus]